MRKRFTIILFLLLASSCVEPIVMDPLEEMPVAVKCVLIRPRIGFATPADEPTMQYLDLYYAKRPGESSYRVISDAIVSVTGGGATYGFSWNGERWECDLNPVFGTEYSLYVRLRDGKELRAKTKFPLDVWIGQEHVFSSVRGVSCAMYFTVQDFGEDCYLWLTAPENREKEIDSFCTNHPGVDNSNIINRNWRSLQAADIIMADFNKILKSSLFQYDNVDPGVFNKYLQEASKMPVHKDYLRIRHPKEYEDWFILATNTIDVISPSGWLAPELYGVPMRMYSVSEEYDRYLAEAAKRGLGSDELVNSISYYDSFNNIEGGIGIFGAAHYR